MGLHSSVQKVQKALNERGLDVEIIEFSKSTRTAAEAAEAIGTSVAQIAKSLIFLAGDEPILVITSGANRVDTDKLKAITGREIRQAGADTVRDATGYPIGGVPPVGHRQRLTTYLDEDFLKFETIYAAGGTPNAIFPISSRKLIEITGGKVINLKEESGG
ncbi:MAG: YbaK/EbsC family protein [Candidatus Bipolaricaulia bacterium]